jgi:hypothetical protein
VLASVKTSTRGAYLYFTVANLESVQPNADVCSWWPSAWGWWYAQYVDGHRRDVSLVPQGPDDCVKSVLPQDFGKRAVYVPAITDGVKKAPYVFFPSRDLWLAVAPSRPLVEGALLKGPDEKIYVYQQGQRHWVPSLDVFANHGFNWDEVQLTPDYTLKDIPEGSPLAG